MSATEIVVLVVVVTVAVGALMVMGSSGSVGPKSARGRLRGRSERDTIERDRDPTFYAPQGGHHPDLPGTRKPPNEGGLL